MRVITKTPSPVWKIVDILPDKLSKEIYRVSDKIFDFEENVCEIRIRAGRTSSLTCQNENVSLGTSITKEEIEQCVKQICGGSIYAYSDMINRGYIYIDGGCRIGIVGSAVVEEDKIVGVRDISSLNIRIARNIIGIGAPVLDALKKSGDHFGVLVYSSPGVGKTTLLRSLATELSRVKRVAIVDSRGELDISDNSGICLCDVLSAYPKGEGIEIAARTLSPEYIICDEIGPRETREIAQAALCGVPLIASVHASSYDQLMEKEFIKRFFDAGVFGMSVGITRKSGQKDLAYDIRYPMKDRRCL